MTTYEFHIAVPGELKTVTVQAHSLFDAGDAIQALDADGRVLLIVPKGALIWANVVQ